MKTLNVKLSNGLKITLTEEDVKTLKPIIDLAFANLDDSVYKRIKGLKPNEVKAELESMNDEELLNFAQTNDLNPIGGHVERAFTTKIWAELFKRNGYGKPSGIHLSFKQEAFLKGLGLKTK